MVENKDECYCLCRDICDLYLGGGELTQKDKQGYDFFRGIYYLKKFNREVCSESKMAQRYFRKSGWGNNNWIPKEETLDAMVDVELGRNFHGPFDSVEEMIASLEPQ
ncbi:MAG: hypothetical protein KKF50_04840 [Nanoarchaeota archaeon]|nr:hypothetical protein [Nanoarchaeota archaeon]